MGSISNIQSDGNYDLSPENNLGYEKESRMLCLAWKLPVEERKLTTILPEAQPDFSQLAQLVPGPQLEKFRSDLFAYQMFTGLVHRHSLKQKELAEQLAACLPAVRGESEKALATIVANQPLVPLANAWSKLHRNIELLRENFTKHQIEFDPIVDKAQKLPVVELSFGDRLTNISNGNEESVQAFNGDNADLSLLEDGQDIKSLPGNLADGLGKIAKDLTVVRDCLSDISRAIFDFQVGSSANLSDCGMSDLALDLRDAFYAIQLQLSGVSYETSQKKITQEEVADAVGAVADLASGMGKALFGGWLG